MENKALERFIEENDGFKKVSVPTARGEMYKQLTIRLANRLTFTQDAPEVLICHQVLNALEDLIVTCQFIKKDIMDEECENVKR